MSATKPLAGKKNLLLCLDAFGTLFTPSKPIPIAYAKAAARHGINVGNTENPKEVGSSFKSAFKKASKENPNYGKATNLGAEKWWANVIEDTFRPFLNPNQSVPLALTRELLHTYSSKEGYNLYNDVRGFFDMLHSAKQSTRKKHSETWPWNRTIVGIITNSDNRVPGILSSLGLRVSPRRYGVEAKGKQSIETGVSKDNDVDFTVLSYDVGFEKPGRRIFAAAEELLTSTLQSTESGSATPPSSFEKLYVGDDLVKDVYGAEDAGWSSVLVQRDEVNNKGYGLKVSEEDVEGGEKNTGKRTVTKVGNLSDLCAWRPREQREVS